MKNRFNLIKTKMYYIATILLLINATVESSVSGQPKEHSIWEVIDPQSRKYDIILQKMIQIKQHPEWTGADLRSPRHDMNISAKEIQKMTQADFKFQQHPEWAGDDLRSPRCDMNISYPELGLMSHDLLRGIEAEELFNDHSNECKIVPTREVVQGLTVDAFKPINIPHFNADRYPDANAYFASREALRKCHYLAAIALRDLADTPNEENIREFHRVVRLFDDARETLRRTSPNKPVDRSPHPHSIMAMLQTDPRSPNSANPSIASSSPLEEYRPTSAADSASQYVSYSQTPIGSPTSSNRFNNTNH